MDERKVTLGEGGEGVWVVADGQTEKDKVVRDMAAERVTAGIIGDEGVGLGMSPYALSDSGVGIDAEGTYETDYVPPRIDSPVVALDTHLSQWQWCMTEPHKEATWAFMKSYYALPTIDNAESVDIFAEQEKLMIGRGVTHHVSPDVADMLEQMGHSMPPDMLNESDLPMRNGFLVLGKTWEYLNFDHGDYTGILPVRAICWEVSNYVGQPDGSTKPGVYVYLYVDKAWMTHIKGVTGLPEGFTQPLILIDMWAWSFDTWWEQREDGQEADIHHASKHVGEMRRNLLALWRFMNDEIVLTERTRMPRPALRRWGRSGKKMPLDGSIVTIHLRRIRSEHYEGGEPANIDWSHRWWVRGHHRFNPKTGQKDIWVRPHLKGPDDKPIVMKEKLVVVDR